MAKEPYLFVSYSHSDTAAVDDFSVLEKRGITIWYDESLHVGNNWRDELALMIDESAGILFFVSAGSLASPFCKEEIDYALRQDKLVVTIFSEPVELSPGLNMALGSRQAILRSGLDREVYLEKLVFAADQVIRPSKKSKIDRHSIAIMRFENLSSDPDNAYLADGIAEELLIGLAKIEGVSIASRSSSFAIAAGSVDVRQVGQLLKVAWVLEGSVRRAGNRIRVTARLSESNTGTLAWAENFDRELVDLFDLQDDIAGNVLSELTQRFDQKLQKPELDFGTANIEAYNAYLQGRHESLKFTSKSADLAVAHLRRAIQLDANFLRARLSLITSLESLRMIIGRDGLTEEIAEQRRILRKLDPAGQVVNWDAHDQLNADSSMTVLDANERMLSRIMRHPDDILPVGINADRWWAGGFSVDDGASGKLDAKAQYGLLLAEAGLYQSAKSYFQSAEFESSAYVNVQMILGDLVGARLTIEKYIEANPQIAIHYFTHMIILDRLGLHQEADECLDRVLQIVDAGLAQVAQLLKAYWTDKDDAVQRLSVGIDDIGVPLMFRALCRVATDHNQAMTLFNACNDAKEPFAPAARVWIPSYIKQQDWLVLSDRRDMQDLLRRIGIGDDWRDEMRARAISLSQITGISIPELPVLPNSSRRLMN